MTTSEPAPPFRAVTPETSTYKPSEGVVTTAQQVAVLEQTCSGPGVKHWYCCDENLSWCLADISDHTDCPDRCGCLPCVVCEGMEAEPCPRGCNAAGGAS